MISRTPSCFSSLPRLALAATALGEALCLAATPTGPLVQSNQQFAVELYQQVRTQPGNLCFSPYSISTALALTYAGARGETATQMANTLHFGLAQPELPAAFATLAQKLVQTQQASGAEFLLANSLWCQRDYPLAADFLGLARKEFAARVESVDFVNSPAAACRDINAWVEQQTRDRIKNLIAPAAITPLTRLVLANAVYFKAGWQTQFAPEATKPGAFHLTATQDVTADLMHQKARLKLAQVGEVQLLEMPYRAGQMSMVVLLPAAVEGLAGLEAQLTAEHLRAWLQTLDSGSLQEVSVTLPRFKTTASLDLAKTLARMGMPMAFSARDADFSGLTGTRDLYLSDVVHKAFVEVNEEGTEAAAATGAIMSLRSAPRLREFRADHPFVFLIRDHATGSILFLGRMMNPAE